MTALEKYKAMPGVNFSLLKNYLKTPAHFRYAQDNPDDKEETEALIFGAALHCFVLEPQIFEHRYAFLDLTKRPVPDKDFKTKANRDWKKEMIASFAAEGKVMLTSEQLNEIETLGGNIKKCKPAYNLLHDCKKEFMHSWVDEDSGVLCKILVDFHDDDRNMPIHGDLKSMKDASPNGVSYFLAKYLTNMQLAFYADGLANFYKKEFNTPFIIAAEKSAPYIVQPYFVKKEAIELGRAMYKSLLNVHVLCEKEKSWEGYSQFNENTQGIIVVDLPKWAYDRTEAIKMLQDN